MLFLIALIGAVLVGLLVWKVLSMQRQEMPDRSAPPSRVTGPDDDPEFLRQLEQRRRADDDPPQPR